MRITEKRSNDVLLLIVDEETIGGIESRSLYHHIKNRIAYGIMKLVFDLSNVKWISSSGLGVLIAIRNAVKENEGDLKLVGATNRVQNLLTLIQLIHFFEIPESIEQAIASFND